MQKFRWTFAVSASLLFVLAAAISTPAQTFITLHRFVYTGGAEPYGLVQASNGFLYGTTYAGGSGGEHNAAGTAFRISLTGKLTTLDSFCLGCGGGHNPEAGVIQATDGNLYGTTVTGGSGGNGGSGMVFKMTPGGALSTLYSFCSQRNCTDGSYPEAELIQGTDGNFYGTTALGGLYNGGTVFQITPGGLLTTLYSFCSDGSDYCPDGSLPVAALVEGTDGNFYGTTAWGGNSSNSGTVFKITPGGALTTLYGFCAQTNCTDGGLPFAGLVQASDGNLYGTTEVGGANQTSCTLGCGTVFKITPTGVLTTLYSFCAEEGCTDGSYPISALIQATDGNLYGTTYGAESNTGTVFKITLGGTFTTLHNFCTQNHCADGSELNVGLIQDTSGTFYGTTKQGGNYTTCAAGCGTVFSLSVGLGPFVKMLPTSGRVGASIGVLGTNLTGATSVRFNGTPATFTVVSPSLITTTVPAGATTGTVQVVTPGGTLKSNVPFRVIQ